MDVEITWKGAAAKKASRQGGVRGLQLSTELLLGEAVKIVPLEEGTLQHSGKAAVDESTMTGIVSFGTPYAVIQHERLDFHHANGREAKYLEKPWRANAPKFAEIIAYQIKKALG